MVGIELAGERVRLRPLRDDDLDRRVEWLADSETHELFTGGRPSRMYRRFDAERWRESLEADRHAIVFAIDTCDGRHIGDIDLHAINRPGRTAKLTVLVGDKSAWNCGFGTDAVRTVLRYAFADLGLEQVKLRVFNFNERAVRCYEKCGFKRTGDAADEPQVSSRDAEAHMAVAKKWFMAD